MHDLGYIAFIDEAGDDGIRRVRPIDPNGASEWLVLSALVIQSQQHNEPRAHLRRILAGIDARQRRDLHFNKLSAAKRIQAVKLLSEMQFRCFTMISHKPSMRGYRNDRAALRGSRNYFYNFMVRLLLERVTNYCYEHSIRAHGFAKKMEIVFSTRGGHSYSHTRDYLALLAVQSHNRSLHLSKRDIAWPVIDLERVVSRDHGSCPGVQLADIVASSFFQGLPEAGRVGGEPLYALTLQDKLGRGLDGRIWDCGVSLMPKGGLVRLLEHQKVMLSQFIS